MNKKLKIIVSVLLIIQLALPVYFLVCHCYTVSYAVRNAPEYKFDLEYLHISDYDDDKNSLSFEISGLSYRTAAITTTINGFAVITSYNGKKKTDSWFSRNFYAANTFFPEDKYSLEPGADIQMLKQRFSEYKLIEQPDGKFVSATYITAKVYKGVFIPTALYYEDQKILTFTVKS